MKPEIKQTHPGAWLWRQIKIAKIQMSKFPKWQRDAIREEVKSARRGIND